MKPLLPGAPSRREALATAGRLLACGTAGVYHSLTAQTRKPRLNPLIAKLEQGKPVLTPDDWMFIDMEHGPYLVDRLQQTLNDLGGKRNADGVLQTAPIVRLPQDGDEDFRWSVKQVLDMGAFGLIFSHIESKEQAIKAIRAVRYPPQRGAKHPEPVGQRGWAPGRAVRYWGITQAEYLQRADVWPLNPDGELFAMLMIESVEGAKHIDDILDVPGIGAIFLGPSDLGVSLGVGPAAPLPPPEDEALIQAVLKACKAKKVICGYPVLGGESELKQRLAEGFQVILNAGAMAAAAGNRP
jgi:4-hydroxy-2-oxoheptanedioate aldolase